MFLPIVAFFDAFPVLVVLLLKSVLILTSVVLAGSVVLGFSGALFGQVTCGHLSDADGRADGNQE